MTTTARLYHRELYWIQKCMRQMKIKTVAKFLEKWHNAVIRGQQKNFYNNLVQEGEKKRLKGVCIQKSTSHFR